MGWVREIMQAGSKFFKWWVVVAPWEQALRIRGGKRAKLLHAGIHFRIPFWDRIYRQSVRMKAISVPSQTVSTADGMLIEVGMVLSFQVDNLERMYDTIDGTGPLLAQASAAAADHISQHDLKDIRAVDIERVASEAVPLAKYGLASMDELPVRVLHLARVRRAYRLITGGVAQDGGYYDGLDVNSHDDRDN